MIDSFNNLLLRNTRENGKKDGRKCEGQNKDEVDGIELHFEDIIGDGCIYMNEIEVGTSVFRRHS